MPDRYPIKACRVHDADIKRLLQGNAMNDQPGPPQGSPPKKKRKKWPFLVGGIILLIIIGIANSNGGGKSTTAAATATAAAPATTSAAPAPTTRQAAASAPSTTKASAPTTDVAPVQLMCSDVAGVFVPHGTDGRGSCESANPRPSCHVPPAAQDPNYLAELTMSPPFPGGTVDYPFLIGMASNKDCWKQPAGQ